MVFFANGKYSLENNQNFQVPFYYCQNCNCIIRDVENLDVVSHLKTTSYNNIKYEKTLFDERVGFLKYIFSLTKKYKVDIYNWLDIGCSYGHLIEFLNSNDIISEGIDIALDVRMLAKKRGLVVYESIDKIPHYKMYDVVSLIDTLYYSTNPTALIKKIYERTSHNGLLVLKISNRISLAKMIRMLKKDVSNILGDYTINFSRKGISYLLENSGFKILKITYLERKKQIPIKRKLFYYFALIIYFFSLGIVNILPGMIVIARKQ